jgi:GR25 family glycosyltransferase involved in LPS biosynthesis
MKNPFDFFDAVFCITIDPKSERFQMATAQFKELGINAETLLSKATTPPQEGCTWGHQECVRLAKERGCKNVFIFEDDVLFINYDATTLSSAIQALPRNWELFFLGGTLRWAHNTKQITPHLLNGRLVENHAYAVNSHAFDKILSWKLEPSSHVTVYHSRLCESFLVNPMMAVQLDPRKPRATSRSMLTFNRTKYISKKFT